MPLTVDLVTSENDLDRICEVDYDGWHTPYNPQLKHFRPITTSREEYITWNRKRNWIHPDNPKHFLVKCTETDTDTIIGFAVWTVNDGAEENSAPTKALWHVEGSDDREFAERFINGLWGFLGKRVTRPHMGECLPSLQMTGALMLSEH